MGPVEKVPALVALSEIEWTSAQRQVPVRVIPLLNVSSADYQSAVCDSTSRMTGILRAALAALPGDGTSPVNEQLKQAAAFTVIKINSLLGDELVTKVTFLIGSDRQTANPGNSSCHALSAEQVQMFIPKAP